MCDRFSGWTTQDDKRANAPADPFEVWQDAAGKMAEANDRASFLIDSICDRASCGDAEIAERARAIAERMAALNAEMAQLLKDA